MLRAGKVTHLYTHAHTHHTHTHTHAHTTHTAHHTHPPHTTHRETEISNCHFSFTATAGSSYSLGSVQLSASYSSYEIMRPSIHSTKQPTQLHSQAEQGRQTLHHYQSLKEMSPDSDYTLPIARPCQSR